MRRALPLLFVALACRPTSPAPPPPPPSPFRLTTLNTANGAGDVYRTAATRAAQVLLVAGSDLVALQEVDVGVERSGRVDAARAVAGPAFEGCTPAVASAPHLSEEGLARCSSDAGTVLFALGFRGDDLFSADDAGIPGGIDDGDDTLNPAGTDRGHDALFGNALVVRGRPVDSAVVVALPISAGPASLAEYATLSTASEPERAAHNLAIRSAPGVEPRSLLVARLGGTAVLVTHLETGSSPEVQREQLAAALVVARAERAAGRRVVLAGDLNMSPAVAATQLEDAGFARAAGEGLDQLWADPTVSVRDVDERATAGSSDHPTAPTATFE